ncbi:acetyl-CoA acetyltransferase [Mobilicoccus massiliensis]|uniref:acetyl-CoA acetyltransferase n=1 Tax=Mobilicoccus massiliensis TaxID=1522310 RepID=UPI00058C3660|nr:acetyl-CoA acetyltransferase [Mobilicoccus massiliensis]
MATLTELDPRTPVVIGVGQVSERLGEPGYEARGPVGLAGDAAAAALADSSAGSVESAALLRERLDVVAVVRQFEDSGLEEPTPLGRADNVPRAVARRIGAEPRRAVLGTGGGQSPHDLVVEFCAEVAAGRADVVLVAGAEALSSARYWAGRDEAERPDWNERVGGDLEDRGPGLADMTSPRQSALGLDHAPAAYALFENARRARLGRTRAEYARSMGELFAPFTEVAAENPHAAAPTRRSPDELVTVTDRNRIIAEPYPRFVVARDQVNQGAAVLLTSLATARELGVPEGRLVFCHGHAAVKERPLLERADLSTSRAAALAVRAVLAEARLTAAELDLMDVYSCFPVAVSVVVEALGLDPADPRGFTVTGGLPFFGGPGNDYALHSLAEMVTRLRERPGSSGLVTANGGILSSQSMGVWSTDPAPWRPGRDAELAAEVAGWEAPPLTDDPRGAATIETYTVIRERDGSRRGIVVGRLTATGERFLAAAADDPATWALLDSPQPVGAVMSVGPDGLVHA